MNAGSQVLTTWDEVHNCRKVALLDGYEFRDAVVVAGNPLNGLAILQTGKPTPAYATFRTTPPTAGEDVSIFTYPVLDGLLLPLAAARGLVRNSPSPEGGEGILQSSAFADGQSAGGPIVDGRGAVIGIIVSKPNTGWPSGDVGYGISNFVILKFLFATGVEVRTRGLIAFDDAEPTQDVAAAADDYTVSVICFR